MNSIIPQISCKLPGRHLLPHPSYSLDVEKAVEYCTNHHDQKLLRTTSRRRIGGERSLPGIIESVSKINEGLPPKDSKEYAIKTASKPGSWN